MSIVEFLEARIAEDEAQASNFMVFRTDPATGRPGNQSIRTRVLAECAAKRAILGLYEQHRMNRDARRRTRDAEDDQAAQDRRMQEARTRAAEDAVLFLAAVYADHEDYQPEWAPSS